MKKRWWIVIAVVVALGVAGVLLCKKFCKEMGCCKKTDDSFTPV